MYTCMAKECTLIIACPLQRMYSLPMQGPRMCVCMERITEAQQIISKGISIIMYFAEKKPMSSRKCREMSGSIEIAASFPGSHM